jgi:SAM-dependent methyltransferase
VISPETRAELERRFYPQLDEVVFQRFARQLAARLPEGAVVLDAGSGPGTWVLEELHEQIGLLVGVDVYVPDAMTLDALVLGRIERLPFADGSFDLVLAYLMIEHLAEPATAWGEIARVLKPGGAFCFKTPAVATPLFILSRLLPTSWHQRLKARIGTPEREVFPTYYRANALSRLDGELHAAGFHRDWLATVDQTYAYLPHTRATYALGLLYSRLTEQPFLRGLRNQILGVYRVGEGTP